jgi:hypothetical protein
MQGRVAMGLFTVHYHGAYEGKRQANNCWGNHSPWETVMSREPAPESLHIYQKILYSSKTTLYG